MTKALVPAFVIVALVCHGIPALAQAPVIQEVKAEPAWCGGSWQPTMLQEVTKDGQTTTVPIAGTAGTNFGACVPIMRPVKALDGKESVLAIPTYPAHPATAVIFMPDAKTGEMRAGRMLTETDKDGKSVSKWAAIEPTVVPAAK